MSDQLLGPRHTHRTESTASPDLACRPQRQIEVGRGARGPINKDTCLFFFFVGGGGGSKSSQVLKIVLGNWATHVYDTLHPWKTGHRAQTHISYKCNAEPLSSVATKI